ncbi:dimeric alpha+beta barrel [Coleophoma crateriformis]|uniref:Dimeric alpha+beta barrel n=1 Tax=Coleophoma crateriformis TaxID=565419 RepID=A0A3D8R368_9HELO|nr:dimeric alpha+beta barrel [Coleophoma crateriformis]
MASQITGPGILYVNSKIARADILDEAGYMKWYEEDHIPEIIEIDVIKSALRWKDVDPKADKPYLVTYPMQDIGFTQSPEFKKIAVHSKLLPGGGPIYDLADIDVRYYGLIQVFDPTKLGAGKTKFIMTAAMETGDGLTDEEFDDWYRKEHLGQLSHVPGYVRTTRYKLLYYRTNAQSRELKGLPPRDADIATEAPPTWLAIHEFDSVGVDQKKIMALADTEWSKKILANVRQMLTPCYTFVKGFGDSKFFHE